MTRIDRINQIVRLKENSVTIGVTIAQKNNKTSNNRVDFASTFKERSGSIHPIRVIRTVCSCS